MSQSTERPPTSGQRIFETCCGYCGARFRVLASPLPSAAQVQDYSCPECGRQYELDGLGDPQVLLLAPRSDGKQDRYQETMF